MNNKKYHLSKQPSSESVVMFDSMQALSHWLQDKGINTAVWGQNGRKSVEHLWKELLAEDVVIQDSPPMRVVNVVQIIIRRSDLILLETIQEMASGQKRYRNLPPAEKIKFGETYLYAAARGLEEELGVQAEQIKFNLDSHTARTFVSESPSYPGLLSQYTIHDIEAVVSGIPDKDFWYDNLSFKKGDPVLRHFWAWSAADQRNLALATTPTV